MTDAGDGAPVSAARDGAKRDLARSHTELGGDTAAVGGASSSSSSSRGAGGAFGGGQLRLPLLCREAFGHVVYTSATTRAGLEELDAAVLELAGKRDGRGGEYVVTGP